MKREYHQVEKRLVADFVREHYAGLPVWDRIRLGPYKSPVHGTQEERKQAVWDDVVRRWADAVVFDGEALHIIEGKVIADAQVAGQLEHYAELIRETPEFSAFEGAKIHLVVVAAQVAEDIKSWLEARGIEVYIYLPDWMEKYLEQRKYR
jgi:RecB family endonuclease NucS